MLPDKYEDVVVWEKDGKRTAVVLEEADTIGLREVKIVGRTVKLIYNFGDK